MAPPPPETAGPPRPSSPGPLSNQDAFILLALALVAAAAGAWLFRDYGLSWDEPLFYKFARTMLRAYSPAEQRAGTFDFERDIDTDHWYYGPAYVLLATPAVRLLQASGLTEVDAWRLANLASFVFGWIVLYLLARRWLDRPAALGAALLTASQPVLWGHAFINPKDIPLTSFFLAAVYLGLRLVDQIAPHDPTSPEASRADAYERSLRRLRLLAGAAALLIALAWLLTPLWNQMITTIVGALYQAPAEGLLGRLFRTFAAGADVTPLAVYLDRGLEALPRVQRLVTLAALPWILPGLALTLWPRLARRFLYWLDQGPLGPLPSMPSLHTTPRQFLRLARAALLPGVALGLAISIRVVSPLAGALVLLYFLLQPGKRSWLALVPYALVAALASYLSWPYLWGAPLARFAQVFRHMASNPQILPVLFQGQVFASDALPPTYLSVLLARTLSEPVWPLVAVGLISVARAVAQRRLDWRPILVVLLWFLIPFAYVVGLRPPMYDGYRHFLFLLPPVFVFAGFGLQAIFNRLRSRALQLGLVAAVAAFGVLGIARTHPYEYAYHNALAGGLRGAFRRFETDYWLTCYQESMAYVNRSAAPGTTLFALRQPANAQYYASDSIRVERFEPDVTPPSGSLVLLTTRTNIDQVYLAQEPTVYQAEKDGAVLCVIRRIR
jgi:hypothetical protein